MEDILVSIAICCILPLGIVLTVFIAAMNADNKRAKVLIKAIEANPNVDPDKLASILKKPVKTPRQILNKRLLWGCIFSLTGLVLCIMGIVNLCAGVGFESDPVSVPLAFGGISLAIGLSFLIVYYVTRKQLKD